jgi:hypothetical protein
MATILGKLFGAIKTTVDNWKTPPVKARVDTIMRATDKPATKHGPTPYGRATTKGAFGSTRRNKLGRKMMRRYGYYNVMLTQPAVRDKIIAKLTAKPAIEAPK